MAGGDDAEEDALQLRQQPRRLHQLLLGGAPPATAEGVWSPPPAFLATASQAVHVEALAGRWC